MTEKSDRKGLSAIPQPKPSPLIGNVLDINIEAPVQSLIDLQKVHGPIYRLQRPGGQFLVVSSEELVRELCDEKRFDKFIHTSLERIRDFAGDGLFTAHSGEENWGIAHRVLVPAFGAASIRDMFPAMLDIAEQMLIKWERLGPDTRIDVVDNMTRLTLDTIALCAFDYRFNSFYAEAMHPFVHAMVGALAEAGARANRLELQTRLMLMTDRQYTSDVKYMNEVADELIRNRRASQDDPPKMDLLGRMLAGKDPQTGRGLSDTNIRYQLVTFLIAGHETTSGLLSFTMHLLLKHPTILAKARDEADRVLAGGQPKFEHIAKLTYIDQIFKETLRLWPTAPGFAVSPGEDTILGEKFQIKKGDFLLVLLPALHRDPKVWDEPDMFRPERFAPENLASIPPHAWKPFGNGKRACIGRPFAMQEAILVLAMMLQKFDITEADPSYQLRVKETLTLKPDGLFIKARRRVPTDSSQPTSTKRETSSTTVPKQQTSPAASPRVTHESPSTPLLVLYGSNSGSSESFAQRIAREGKDQGFVTRVDALDHHVGNLPKAGAVVIVTASYEGLPPDNARNFVGWLETLDNGALDQVSFAVFGCGNRDWSRSYQAIPKKIDAMLEQCGAARLLTRGEGDARGDFFGDFDRWYADLWPQLKTTFNVTAHERAAGPLFVVEDVTDQVSPLLATNGLRMGVVMQNRELADMRSPLGRSKRHIEIELPPGQTYHSGDYLAVLPDNPKLAVGRALRLLGYSPESYVQIRSSQEAPSHIPTGRSVLVSEILERYVELGQPATAVQIQALAKSASGPGDKAALTELSSVDSFKTEILEKRVSILDLLERFPSCRLELAGLLEMLPPLKPRLYSISSSPLANPKRCTVTVAVVGAPAWSGLGKYEGVASNFFAKSPVGGVLPVATRPSKGSFRLPESLQTPIIMVGAGTGLAPFRGFIQERSIRAERGESFGKALLYFGCDHPDVDYIYRDELEKWQAQGVVQIRPTFCHKPQNGHQYVQHRILTEKAEILTLLSQDAHVFVCGDGNRMAPAVRDTFIQIYRDANQLTAEQGEEWIRKLEKGIRYVVDVFG